MKTSMILDDEILHKAQEYTNIKNRTELVHKGLNALIEREAARRLALMGGTDKKAIAGRRRGL
ncbi:MAG: type II toxin-antitoxin system VapB family antitoxin [Spirochaetes bacterium]|nr:type II toxin-antitoxin system VapB family antitoxin [Spirochaetota bacterium]MBX3720546.1 type II toxin-antitoxin system VapB family antitoxin [Turneriella sp.]